jgi:hypothetical protein
VILTQSGTDCAHDVQPEPHLVETLLKIQL